MQVLVTAATRYGATDEIVRAIGDALRAEAQCMATYALPGGQITGQALIVLGDPTP